MMNINKDDSRVKRVPKSFRKSFTLSELLLAALFLICVLVVIMASFLACISSNEANRNLIIAASHAQYVMEEIKNKASTISGFSDLTSTYVNTNWDWSGAATINAKGLVALKDESIDANVTGTTFLDVTVTVNWHDRGNRDRNTVLETILVEP